MFDLFCIGGASVDIEVKSARMPVQDEKMLVEFAGIEPGGMIANAACAASRLGLKTGWAGMLGGDEFGNTLLQDFNRFGVDASCAMVLENETSDFTVIILSPNGDRTILVVPANRQHLSMPARTLQAAGQSKIGYSMPLQPAIFKEYSTAIKGGGGKVAIDLEGSSPVTGRELEEVIRSSDILFCSKDGLHLAAGTPDNDEGARRLLAMGPALVVVTSGKKGAAAYTPDQAFHVKGYSVPVIDTTGSGDCFHAAFLCGLLEGWSITEALRFSNAAAALSVQGLGARGRLPTRAEVLDFIETQVES